MTGLEIGAIATMVTVGAAIFGLQAWKCSRNSQVEESKDNFVLDLEECTIEGGKVTIKGLHVQANELDKAKSKDNQVDGSIGDKDVSLAALRTIGGGGVASISANAVGAVNMATSFMPSSPQHSHESLLPASGPQGTHIVASNNALLEDFANVLLGFMTKYTSEHLSALQANGATTPLLGEGTVEGEGV
jgi:hypothetical protein